MASSHHRDQGLAPTPSGKVNPGCVGAGQGADPPPPGVGGEEGVTSSESHLVNKKPAKSEIKAGTAGVAVIAVGLGGARGRGGTRHDPSSLSPPPLLL